MHRVNAIGNSLGVHRKLTEGIGSLPRWRKGVRQKKIETSWKIVRSSRKVCRERLRKVVPAKRGGNRTTGHGNVALTTTWM
ncbi:hypothetical protein B296_00054301 [Ensete ventricosum]|uniref:Uncharacterized protein n=1 Tax=Ensete ventricosum TaxID=4639 RepID=A0A426WVR1_ENSVE|nr:hypothetical protein B296_00054301 [Ensete ventricosum]